MSVKTIRKIMWCSLLVMTGWLRLVLIAMWDFWSCVSMPLPIFYQILSLATVIISCAGLILEFWPEFWPES